MSYWPTPLLTLKPHPDHHLTLHLVEDEDGRYETPDGVHTIAYVPGSGWTVDGGRTRWPFPHQAARALHHRLTRYTWHVTPGEQCAVCGQPRPTDRDTGAHDLGWWWHTICRARTDPDGAETHGAMTP